MITSMLYSQEDSFGRLYRQHNTIYSVQETKDSGFILAGNNGIIKTYPNGRVEWQDLTSHQDKVYSPVSGISEAVQDKDGTYLLAYIKAELGASKHFLVNRYNTNGRLISSKSGIGNRLVYGRALWPLE